MEVPDLVRRQLGDEEIEAGVNLGEEDTVCLTATRTLLYRAEGLLSDEKVEEFPHGVERLDVKEGRRKTKFILEYVDGTRTFSVPGNRDAQVLELLLTGVLRATDVTEPDETLSGVFRFSELTVVVTDTRVVKHIGADTWTEDYEVYHYDDLTNLSFEKGSVATGVVMEINGRPQRIKTPNDRARKVQQVIQNAVFQYYGVSSLDQLNSKIATEPETETEDEPDSSGSSGSDIDLGGGIDPLVTDSEEDDSESSAATSGRQSGRSQQGQSGASAGQSGASQASVTESKGDSSATAERSRSGQESTRGASTSQRQDVATAEELAAVEQQLAALTETVERQNKLLAEQQETIDTLISELREGR